MLIDGADEVYFIDRDNCVYQVSSLTFLYRKDKNKHISDTLLGNHFFTISFLFTLLLLQSFYLQSDDGLGSPNWGGFQIYLLILLNYKS